MPKYSVPINGKDFTFDWDKPNSPTQDDIISLYKAQSKPKQGMVRKAWGFLNTPLSDSLPDAINPKKVSKKFSDWVTTPDTETSPTMAKVKGFLGGATEGLGNVTAQLTSPIDLAATTSGLGAVRRAANTPFKIMSAITAARGADNVVEGAYNKDWGKVGAGALEGAMSLLGARSPIPQKKPLLGMSQVEVMPPSSVPAKAVPEPALPIPAARVNPVEGGITTKNVAVRQPNLANGMYGIKDTGTDGFPSVPARMKVGTNQAVMDALLPSSIKDKIKNVKLPEPDNSFAQSNVAPKIQELASHPDPVIQKAAQEVVAANAVPAAKEKKGLFQSAKRVAEEWAYKPMLSVIKQDSEAGNKIGRMMEKAYADYSTWAGQTSNRISKAVEGLSKEELANLPHAINGKALPLNDKVQKAMDAFKTIDNEFMERATKAGLKMRAGGETVPFAPQDNYWARIYPDEFIANKQSDILKDLIAKGMAPDEAASVLKNSKMFGNRLIDSQHGRRADVEGYRLDVDSQKHHYSDLARRIVEAEQFGNMDTADASSPISQLLAKTKDTSRIKPLVDQYLGRGQQSDKGYVHDLANSINKFQVAVQLPLFAIKNQSQKAMIPIKANTMDFINALGKYATKEGKDIAENTGALQSIRDIIHEMGGESKISKYYGISKTEEGNRSLAALTGKASAERLFKQLKNKPTDKIARDKLDELLLEDVDSVLKQDTLTPEQTNRAGFRMAELTQGSANPMHLPSKWSEHPETKLVTLYKRYALQQSKLIKDSIMQDWKKNLPTALVALAAAGELTGDAYTGVKNALTGNDPIDAVAKRGSDNFVNHVISGITGDKDAGFIAGRVARDLSDSMALGLIQDFVESAGSNAWGLASFLGGPNVDKAGKVIAGAAKSVEKGSVKPVAKEILKAVTPVPFNSMFNGKEEKKHRGIIPKL